MININLCFRVVAIKKVKVAKSSDSEAPSLNAMVSQVGINFTVLREIKVMREILDHPNVINLKAVFVKDDFINLVMPHMQSDLRQAIEKRTRFNESQIKCVLKQICEGIKAMHQHFILHRDLAPANVFIGLGGILKVADFGLSRTFGSPRPSKKTPKVVTLWYRSPELLFGAIYYQTKIDIWSIGCIFAELLNFGKPLFPGTGEIDQLGKIFEILGTPSDTNYPDAKYLPGYFEYSFREPTPLKEVMVNASPSAVDILSKMLHLDPNERPDIEEILAHRYFSEPPSPCDPSQLPFAK
eukprot:GHVP01053567.1.p1 GENE.GHVP01053567.1~~GHVP01053567.1.p1  ORF type:complete len:297 (+),score=49.91 GHVP01053567.1:352-1242(+)